MNAKELCALSGASYDQREGWEAQKLLRASGQTGFGLLDVIEAAVLLHLVSAAGPKRGKAAWRLARPLVRDLLPGPPERFWIIVDSELGEHALASSPEAAVAAAALDRAVHVVEVGSDVRAAQERFQAERARGKQGAASGRGASRARVRRLQRRESAS